MKIVVPVSNSDNRLLAPWLDVIEHFGGLEGHVVVFVSTPSNKELCDRAAFCIKDICKESHVLTTAIEPSGGWPSGPNYHFGWTAHNIDKVGGHLPWFWMELDTLPVKSGWADRLAVEYTNMAKKCLGVVRNRTKLIHSGVVDVNPPDRYMMGVGVYPPMLHLLSPLVGDLMKPMVSLVRGVAPKPLPFDIYLRTDLVAQCGHTPLISDHWNSGNYRITGGRIFCEALPQPSNVPQGRAIPTTVPETAILCHGCKDQSLADALLGRAPEVKVSEPVANPEPLMKPTETQMWEAPKLQPVSLIDQLKSASPEELAQLKALFGSPEVPAKHNAPTYDDLTIDAVLAILDEKKQRVDHLAKHFGLKPPKMRKWLDDNKFPVTGPGWVQKPEPVTA